MDLQRAGVEQATIPSEGPVGLELQCHLRQAVIGSASFGSAGDVAQHFTGLLQGEGNAVLGQFRAEAPHITEHETAARYAVEEAERTVIEGPPGSNVSSVGIWIVGGAASPGPSPRTVATAIMGPNSARPPSVKPVDLLVIFIPQYEPRRSTYVQLRMICNI